MKKNILNATAIVITAVLLLTAISTPSCKQKDKKCVGDVTVYDSVGKLLPGAKVKLSHKADTVAGYVSKASNVEYNGVTDSKGKATFEIALPAIYNVRVDHPTIAGKYKEGILILNNPGDKFSEVINF